MIHEYRDSYLAPLVTLEREARAIAEVAEYGTFPDPHPARLAVTRAYIITCTESAKAADDMFTVKAKLYRAEWVERLAQARMAAAADTPSAAGGSYFTVPLDRS